MHDTVSDAAMLLKVVFVTILLVGICITSVTDGIN